MTPTAHVLSRRQFVGTGALAAAALAFGPSFWRDALAAPTSAGAGPYGPLNAPDANGLMLPAGFRSREIARSGQPGGRLPVARLPGRASHLRHAGRWLDPGLERRGRRGAGRRGLVDRVRPGWIHQARPAHPRRQQPELLRWAHAVGHLSLVRGVGRWTGLGVRPAGQEPCLAAAGDGHLHSRVRLRRPGRQARLHDRGRGRRPALPLHPEQLSGPLERRARDRHRRLRRRGQLGGRARPERDQRSHPGTGCRHPLRRRRGDVVRLGHRLLHHQEGQQGPRLRHAQRPLRADLRRGDDPGLPALRAGRNHGLALR